MTDARVLIVGAGPTGLVLALWLTHLKVPVRLIDRAAEPGTTSRALAVQARTLEFYDQIHLAQTVVDRGHRVQAVNFWAAGKRRASAVFGDLGANLSPFSFALVFPQDEHERLLIDRLAELGVAVERGCELTSFEESGGGVRALVKRSDGSSETVEAAYIAGCDGAHSAVRTTLGIGFAGGTYAHLFYVADVKAAGTVVDGNIHVAFDTTDFLAVFARRPAGAVRLVGTVRDAAGTSPEQLSWRDVSGQVMRWLPIEVERVNWFSTYRVHHRVAEHFRRGRAFLLGDAAHVHSPVGGQGMNTGIGDAVNLAWKLAAVLAGRAPESLLDSYEPERIAFARHLVKTTDRAFSMVTSPSWSARFFRLEIFPRLLAVLIKTRAMRRFMFRTVSQTAVNYRDSPISSGRAGAVHGGDRLPWAPLGEGTDNFAPLASIGWQVHVYGKPRAEIEALCRDRSVPLHAFPWRADLRSRGFARDAVYLVRPDGYVGLADPRGEAAALAAYLDARGLKASAGVARPPRPS
jgi:2-polyprenyl-6-methoxyphenol hydroxylase-like FAD-dependent oxidoreductase